MFLYDFYHKFLSGTLLVYPRGETEDKADLIKASVVAPFLTRRLELARRVGFERRVVDSVQPTLVCSHVPAHNMHLYHHFRH